MICYRKNYQDTWYYKFRKEISDYITEEPIYFKELVSHSKKCLHEFDNEVLGEIFFRYEDLYKKIKKNRKKDCSRQIEEEIIRIKDFFSKKYGFSKEKGYYDISDKLDKEKFTIKLITELQLERYLKADLTIAIFSALEEYKTLGLDINNEFINALCDIDGLYVGSPVLLSMSVLHMYNAVQKNRNTKIIASYFDSIHTQYIEALFETVEVTIPILKCYIRSQLFFFLNKGILKNNNAEDKYDEIDNLIIDILLDYIIMSMDKIKIINQMPNMIIFPEGKESRLDGRQDITDYVKELPV